LNSTYFFTSIDSSYYTRYIIIKITTTLKVTRYFIRQKGAGIIYKIFRKVFYDTYFNTIICRITKEIIICKKNIKFTLKN